MWVFMNHKMKDVWQKLCVLNYETEILCFIFGYLNCNEISTICKIIGEVPEFVSWMFVF